MAYAQSKTTLDKLEYTILNLVENISYSKGYKNPRKSQKQ